MIRKFIQKYFAIIFLLASFTSSMHHHDDLLQHDDCKVCVVQSNIFNADLPSDATYLSQIDIKSEGIITKLSSLHLDILPNEYHSRAPPLFS